MEFSLFISTKNAQICCSMGLGCLDLLDLLRIGPDLDLTLLGIKDNPECGEVKIFIVVLYLQIDQTSYCWSMLNHGYHYKEDAHIIPKTDLVVVKG